MRIDAFELDCFFRERFTLAEVLNGRAAVLRAIRVRNVRGDETSWLKLQLMLDDAVVCQKSIRKLPLGDEERAAALESRLCSELVLPAQTRPGAHRLCLQILSGSHSQTLPANVEVLAHNVIPTDFVRAPLLPAYIQESEWLRNFAADAIQRPVEPGAKEVVLCLYDALLSKQPVFQPVGGRRYPDCQRISSMRNVLEHGGSCAELSLLFASLLWNIGQAPALLLFEDHMAAGCFLTKPPSAEILTDPQQIERLVELGALLLFEATSVCRQKQHPFEIAQRELLQRRMPNGGRYPPCVLINVQEILRGGMKTVSEASVLLRCGNCGYEEAVPIDAAVSRCPACGQPLPPAEEAWETPPVPVFFSPSVQYAMHPGGAAVTGLKEDGEDVIHVLDVWQGRSVVAIGERAFAKRSLSAVTLPDTLSSIGDYAFSGCKGLRRLNIPQSVATLGTGAFRDSGLQTISLSGAISRVPRLAFAGCAALTSVTLSEGTRHIDEKAFDGCVLLRSVTIPASVQRVARDAFPPHCQLVLLSQKTRVL